MAEQSSNRGSNPAGGRYILLDGNVCERSVLKVMYSLAKTKDRTHEVNFLMVCVYVSLQTYIAICR
jgi:hypothetical protein